MRKTKIICTIGPTSEGPDILPKIIDAGMNVARLNMSHGDHAEHSVRIENLHKLRLEKDIPLAIMLDTKGPEVRTGRFENDSILLTEGDHFMLTSRDVPGTQEQVSLSYAGLPPRVKAGQRILIDDGLIEMVVEKVDNTDVHCTVVNGGELSNRKGVSVPDVDLGIPPITDRDREDVLFGIRMGVEYVALSFVCRASDVLEMRKFLGENGGSHIRLLSKIENRMGVDNFDDILAVSDGVMVARGDLGVEIDIAEVPVVQKSIIRKCNAAGKPVITATQMLDSMMRNPRPTRAETNDVANAILDGTDAIMLSGETASGRYPLEAVKTMASIARYTENALPYRIADVAQSMAGGSSITNAVSFACYSMAMDMQAVAIVTPTRSGYTACNVAKYRPSCMLIAPTDAELCYHQMALVWGVLPMRQDSCDNIDDIIDNAVASLCDRQLAAEGDVIVVTAGVPTGVSGTTNLIKVQVVGDVLLRGHGIGARRAIGICCVAGSAIEADGKFRPGDILVVPMTDNEMLPLIKQAGGIIVEGDDLRCHAAVVGFTLDIPVIVDSSCRATKTLKDGLHITIDEASGHVYNGSMPVVPV